MSLAQDIEKALPESMRSKDAVRLAALRSVKAAFSNELVALKRAPSAALSDEEALAVIRRLARQRKDSIAQFRHGGREELARAEEAELAVLESYLPRALSEEEIRKIAEARKTALGITDKSKVGTLIGAVMKETGGRVDGAAVKRISEEILS